MEGHRRLFVFFVTLLVALTASGTALGKCRKSNLPKGNPTVREYSEPVQTVCGPGVNGTGDERSTKLPARVEKELEKSPDSSILKDLATNARRGAPQPARGKEPSRILSSRNQNPVGASLDAATSGNDTTLIALLSVMGAAAAVATLTAIYRRRRTGSS